MSQAASLGSIQKTVWDGKLPLEIVLAPSESRTYDQTDPYLVCFFSTSKVEMGADIFRLFARGFPICRLFFPG